MTWESIALGAGAVVFPPVAIAAGIADFFSNRGQRTQITNNVLTEQLVSATVSSTTECYNIANVSQTVDVTNPTSNYTIIGGGCTRCTDVVNTIITKRHELELLASNQIGSYFPQSEASVIISKMVEACTVACTPVAVSNVNQSLFSTIDTNCTVNADTDTKIQNSLSLKLNSMLTNQQDVLGQLGDSLTGSKNTIANNTSTIMSQSATTSFHNELFTRVRAAQALNVEGSSIWASNVIQSANAKQVGVMNQTNNVNNSMKQTAEFSLTNLLINKNDTLGDISANFLAILTSISDLIENTVGQILVIIGCIVLIMVLVFFGMYTSSSSVRTYLNTAGASRAEQLASKLIAAPPAPVPTPVYAS